MYKNLAATLVAACFFLPAAQAQNSKPATEPLKAGFVYVSPITEAGWTKQHDEGRKAVEKALGDQVRTTFVADVAEGADAERVIRDLAQQGNQIIFTPSFGYMEPTLKVAKEFPNVKFESVTGFKTAANVSASNARYYEGRYLAGIAAGRMTKSNVAGYVAGFPIPEVLQGINAFTLGMRSVNPQAIVKVVWLNAWFDPPKEREAAMALFNQDVDVIPHRLYGGDGGGARARQDGRGLPLRHAQDRPGCADHRGHPPVGRLLHGPRQGGHEWQLEFRQRVGRCQGRHDPRGRLWLQSAQEGSG
jgi:simple sugar transport system substrate-binding protein